MSGYPTITGGWVFRSAAATDRKTIVTALWRMVGAPAPLDPAMPWTDVRPGRWFTDAAAWAAETGVVDGAGGAFSPSATVTRSDAALWAYRALAAGDAATVSARSFTDVAGGERAAAAAWAVGVGMLFPRPDGTFGAAQTVNRRCATMMLWRAAGTPAAWGQSFAGAAVLGGATGWWDTAGWDGTGGAVPDLSGNNLTMTVAGADTGGPVRLGWDNPNRYLYTPGWDDMFVSTPDRPGMPTGSFELRLDGDLTRELATNDSPRNFVFHQGGAGDDAGLAVSFEAPLGGDPAAGGAVTVWTSPDGISWQATSTPTGPTFRNGLGRRGVRFVADDGTGRRRVDLYQQSSTRPTADLDLPFTNPAWTLTATGTAPGAATIHNSSQPVTISSGTDRIPTVTSPYAAGWGRIRRMTLTAAGAAGPVFDLDGPAIPTPLNWQRGGDPADSPQNCWCQTPEEGFDLGPAKQATFTDPAGAPWTITNWQTGSTPSAVADRPALLFGNGARITTGPSPLLDPGPEGLTVAVGYRTTRAGISGMFIHSHRPGTINHDTPGWDSLTSSFIGGGPTFNIGDGTANRYALSPTEPDGDPTTSIGVYNRASGTVTAYTNTRPGTPVAAPTNPTFGDAPTGQTFSIGGDPDPNLHAYGGFEWFAAAVFNRPLTPAELAAVDAYMSDPERDPSPAIPTPIRFA